MKRTTPTSTITMDDIRKELKITGTISLNDAKVRELAKKPNGMISMADLRGRTLITTIHKKVLVFYSYKPNSQGEDIEEYPRFIFPVEHFINGVVRITEFTSNGSYHLFDQCSLNIENPEQVIDLDYEYGGLEGAKQKFKFEIPDSNNNPLKNSYVWITQTGGYYEDWGNDAGPEWIEETTGYKLVMELEADFDAPTDFTSSAISSQAMGFLYSGGKYKFVENEKEYIFRGFVFNDPEELFTCIEPIKHFNIDNIQEESYPRTPNFKIIYTPDEIIKFNLQDTLLYFGFWEKNRPSSFGNVTSVLAFNNEINTNDYYLYDAYWEDIYGGSGTQDDIEFLKHEENCYIGKIENLYGFSNSDINNEGLYQVQFTIYNNI